MLCNHPRRLITWTDSTTHIIVTDGRHQHHRNTLRDAGQVIITCVECGQADAYETGEIPDWVLRVMRESYPAQEGTPTYHAPVINNETHVALPPRAAAEDDGA